MIRTSRWLISSSVQKKLEKSCTHSKYDTVTPPALAITSGATRILRSRRMSSASGVVGPLAPSMTMRVLMWGALAAVIWPSSAAGIRISLSVCQNCSALMVSARKPSMVPLCDTCSISAGTFRPAGSNSAVLWSCTAMTLAPASWNSLAATLPTLPKPCTTMRAPLISRPRLRAASTPTTNTPRPVASRRPSEPPSEIGLPVTTPVDVLPSFIE